MSIDDVGGSMAVDDVGGSMAVNEEVEWEYLLRERLYGISWNG